MGASTSFHPLPVQLCAEHSRSRSGIVSFLMERARSGAARAEWKRPGPHFRALHLHSERFPCRRFPILPSACVLPHIGPILPQPRSDRSFLIDNRNRKTRPRKNPSVCTFNRECCNCVSFRCSPALSPFSSVQLEAAKVADRYEVCILKWIYGSSCTRVMPVLRD